jgi:hypothetical protein
MIAAALAEQAAAQSADQAIRDAVRLLLAAETHALMLAELGEIELPPAAHAEPMQLRAVASLYLASTLEAAGLIQAADDLTRMVRSGTVRDLGEATQLVIAFWEARDDRASEAERLALFGRLFGAPAGPVDTAGGLNEAFEELLLDLCDTIVKMADGQGPARMRMAAQRVAENLAEVANDMVLMMARDIISSLSQAIAILNHPAVRGALMARTMWDAVSAIDRRLRRPARPTLSHLRRGRAGMVVLAWLADFVERSDRGGTAPIDGDDPVLGAALDWVDETIALIRSEEERQAGHLAGSTPGGSPNVGSWHDLGR